MDIADMRSLFRVTRRYAYLNHASIAPLPEPARRAVVRLADRLSSHGAAGRRTGLFELFEQLKSALAAMLAVRPESLALTPNTTEGILIAANGLSVGPKDNVVIAAGEFPANVQPWRALSRAGVEVRTVPETEGRIRIADIARTVDERTAAVALSFVEFSTGFRNDLAAVSSICRDAEALFVVDAIQGLGALRLSPEAVGVDVLAGGAHKWMLACPGIGFAYFSDRALAELRVANMGWLGVAKPAEFLDYDQPLAPGARRFETGSAAVLAAAALLESTKMLNEIGSAAVEAKVLELADHVDQQARDAGLRVCSPRDTDSEKSGIVILETPWEDSARLAQRLEKDGVVVAPRGRGLRVAAHAYNTNEELDRLVELLISYRDRAA